MGKKIIIKVLLILALPNFLFAQKMDTTTSLSHLLIVQATISPGFWFYKKGLWNSYFHCTLEWCFDKRVSVRADGSYFFSSQGYAQGDYQPIRTNNSLLLGAFYHCPKKKGDFYFGIQPGAACVQQNTYKFNDSIIKNPQLKVVPLITATVGANYFFWKYMNMFAGIKYIHGTYIPPYGNTIPLDEIRISFGIGWHVQFKKDNVHAIGYK
ncbi:MAG: hypothetical protein ABR968_12950 [Bacteroidales bacterium]|jgi:hypothetical protein